MYYVSIPIVITIVIFYRAYRSIPDYFVRKTTKDEYVFLTYGLAFMASYMVWGAYLISFSLY